MDKLHFINPEYLWGLLFLLIPIAVHLFNFRKAQKVLFTRVDLLKEIKTEKRKFSKLKKRLILLSRLLAILFLVLATSSPYISNVDLNEKSSRATFLYIDNSFSMQAKSSNSTLLELAKKEVVKSYSNFKTSSQIFLITNSTVSLIESESDLMLELSKIDFSYERFSTLGVKSKVSTIATDNSISDFSTLVFSDFNESTTQNDSLFGNIDILERVIVPSDFSNVSIDSLWLKSVNVAENKFTINYKISKYNDGEIEFDETFKFNDKTQQALSRKILSDTILEIVLNIPQSKFASGVVQIEDGSVWYDNELFFSVDFRNKSKVLFVGEKANLKLSKILNDDFVSIENTSHSGFALQDINDFDVVIYSLGQGYSDKEIKLLKNYLGNEKSVLLLPSKNTSSKNFNRVLSELKLGRVAGYSKEQFAITGINYSNKFFDDIFNSKVENFDYPFVEGSFKINISPSEILLKLENGNPFLLRSNNVFIFTSDVLEGGNSFVNQDLALPVFYKMASAKLRRKLYEQVGDNSSISIENIDNLRMEIGKEKIELNEVSFSKYELPRVDKSHNYLLYSKNKIIGGVSYNYKRTESTSSKKVEKSISKNKKYEVLKNRNNVIYLWKWCITFTLAFLIIEMLLISFFKEREVQ